MGWSASAIYEVAHTPGGVVPELRIQNDVMKRARNGEENYRAKICMAYRSRIKTQTGRDPGYIGYGDLRFTLLRSVEATGKTTRR